MTLSRILPSTGRLAAALTVLLSLQTAPGLSQTTAPLAELVRLAMLHTYIHGVDDELAQEFLGPEAIPFLRQLLRESDFPRRDNVVAFLTHLDHGDATEDLLEFLTRPPAPLSRPEEDRALLLAPQALGHIARRGDSLALEALMEMTAPGARGGPLARSALHGADPDRLQADLVEMALRGLAFSGMLDAGERLAEIAAGRQAPGLVQRDFRRSAQNSLALWEQLLGISPDPGPGQASASDGLRDAFTPLLDPVQKSAETSFTTEAVQTFDSASSVHDAEFTYANHVDHTNPMDNATLDPMLLETSMWAGRGDFPGDVACCVTVTRSGGALTFGTPGDGLDIIDTFQEQLTVLDDNTARFKVIRIINYCSGPVTNVIGCGWLSDHGVGVVRVSLPAKHEGVLWMHEYGHNTGLGHNADSRYIMHGTNLGDNNGLTVAECSQYHSPDIPSQNPVQNVGVCSDNDLDEVQDLIDNCPGIANNDQFDNDGDGDGDACDPDDDDDGVLDGDDNCPFTPNFDQTDTDGDGLGDACDPIVDTDGDGYKDDDETTNCVPPSDPLDALSTPNDNDGDFLCDTIDDDDDNDSVLDGDDSAPFDPTQCQDTDTDTCDDCAVVQPPDPANDGPDTDGDGICDAGDNDADNDGYSNDDETINCLPTSDPLDPASTPVDTDGDLSCDTLDTDDDNDTILDGVDIDPLDSTRCQDLDGDTCDDCSVVQPPDVASDGPDVDADGICDAGDPDADNDGYSNVDETTNCVPASDPLDPFSTPVDTDGDLICNTLDTDDDNDGVSDGSDPARLNPDVCGDSDVDTCDDCAVGTDDFGPLPDADPLNDGPDNDGDGVCDAGDFTLLEANFDIDEDGFVYLDDPFRGTSEPNYTDGVRIDPGGFTGGGVQVNLGGIDGATVVGMSGGWQGNFTSGGSGEVTVSFRYNLTQTNKYESDEVSQVLVSVDGVLYGESPNDYVVQVVGDGNGGLPLTTGWVLFQVNLGVLAPGSHTLILGGYNSKKDKTNESTEVLIDDVLVEIVAPDTDGDGVPDNVDIDPLDPTRCQDLDGDTCDDCSVVQPPDTANDGADVDADGFCDAGDNCPNDPNPGQVDTDGDGLGDACDTTGATTLEVSISSSSDDAQENSLGAVDTNGITLDLGQIVLDLNTVGLVFNGVTVPQGTVVTNAYIQFVSDSDEKGTASLLVEGEDSDNALTFSDSPGDISSRARTLASVVWNPAIWPAADLAGPDQQTPDIASIISTIVGRPGWSSGNSLAIVITGTGTRVAESFDGNPLAAAILHIEYNQP